MEGHKIQAIGPGKLIGGNPKGDTRIYREEDDYAEKNGLFPEIQF
jgi:hypothetical protein